MQRKIAEVIITGDCSLAMDIAQSIESIKIDGGTKFLTKIKEKRNKSGHFEKTKLKVYEVN